MRAALGPALAHLLLLAAGFGVLWVAGVLRDLTPRRMLAAAGLAYLAGVAVVMVVLIALVVMGVSLSLGLFVAVGVLVALPALLGLRHRSAWTWLHVRDGLRGLDLEGRVVAGLVVAMVVFGLVGMWTAGLRPLNEFDAWQLWTRKAVMLFYEPHLPVQLFTSRVAYANVQPDYPLLLPMLEAVQFRAGGRPDTQEAHATTWILFTAGVWALAYLASRTSRPFVWAGVSAGVAAVLAPEALSAYADVTVAMFVGLGILATGLWLERGRRADLVLAAVLLGGGAATKNEGFVGAAIVFAVAIVIAAVERRRTAALAAAGAGVLTILVAVVPWRLWMGAHDVSGTLSLSDGLSPSYLVDRFDRVWPSVDALTSQLVALPAARIIVALGIAIAIARLRSLPRLAAFYLAVGVLYFLSLVWAYWISPLGLQFHIGTSVSRVVLGLVVLAVVAAVHLGERRGATFTDS